jgi:UDP-N-acetylglucosamine diphosphorylase/glucosamine-1-phosphate N-acetyltransferase
VTRLGVFEDAAHARLAPLTHLRPTFLLWSGIAPAWHRLEAVYGAPVRVVRCRAALAALAVREIPAVAERGPHDAEPVLLVNGALLPDAATRTAIPLEGGEEVVTCEGRVAAARVAPRRLAMLAEAPLPAALEAPTRLATALPEALAALPRREIAARFVTHPWDLVRENASILRADFDLFAPGLESRRLARPEEIGVDCYVGRGAQISSKASIDASDGPILVGADARIEPFAFVKGPAFVGSGAIVRAGGRIEGGSTIGPGCRVGGEIEASILQPFSNKQHDGFLGHSLVGSWANLGAGTITSDLKNNYGLVRTTVEGRRVETDLRKLGSVVGDHVKLGIGSLLGAGASIGTAAQIASAGAVIAGAVPVFAWWVGSERAEHEIERAVETARTVVGRRGRRLEPDEEACLRALHADESARREREAWVAGREPR